MAVKGILNDFAGVRSLVGRAGLRLWPMTTAISGKMLPVYDKPTIYYRLTTRCRRNPRDPDYLDRTGFAALPAIAGRWRTIGQALHYAVQPAPVESAQACLTGRAFLAAGPAVLVLGDNIFMAMAGNRPWWRPGAPEARAYSHRL
jgi:glucose-1-phosphate thymidylyltransferase